MRGMEEGKEGNGERGGGGSKCIFIYRLNDLLCKLEGDGKICK